jgi:hypothetical protein
MKVVKPAITVIELNPKEVDLIIRIIKYCQDTNVLQDMEIIIAEEMLTELNKF